MVPNDIFSDEAAVLLDLQLHENLLWSRAALSTRLVEASSSTDTELAETLRIETMYQFCEFFYLLKARRMETVDMIEALAHAHNAYLGALSRDRPKMRRLGLSEDRLNKAVLTGDTLPRLVEVWRDRPGQIDQSNLARFLVTVMSSETCRKLVVAAAEAGFLQRSKSVHGPVLVHSTGVMEQVFGTVLRDLRLRMAHATPEGLTT